MKRIILLTVYLALIGGVGAFAQTSSKTFSKSFNAEGIDKIKFNLPGTVDLKIWNQPTVRIEIHVALPSGSASTLEQLAKVGRYDLKGDVTANLLTISAPNMQRAIKLKGEEVRETVGYVVFLPKDKEVEVAPQAIESFGALATQKKP